MLTIFIRRYIFTFAASGLCDEILAKLALRASRCGGESHDQPGFLCIVN
jgi:hypothetical protein